MVHINENFLKLKSGYLFPEIGRRVSAFSAANPDKNIIKLGIGDVTEPLAPAVVEAMKQAVDEMGSEAGFHGYGPEQGYGFLIDAIIENDYKARGVSIDADEVFISDGSKCDTGNFQEIFGTDNRIAVTDPVYPVYVDTNVMAGRTAEATEAGQYEGIEYLACTEENNFEPAFPAGRADLIYLCYPNNPTGTAATKEQLKKWVDYAIENKSIIFFDAAYEAFISQEHIPHSIYEIDGAKKVAVEFRSFSKTAGFTGARCAFTVVPKELQAYTKAGQAVAVNPIWNRRHTTKFNGVSYITQRGAAAVYSPAGKEQVKKNIDLYMANAALIRKTLISLGYTVYGGINAPYVWVKTPRGLGSWEFFDLLLEKINVVGTPGAGFGAAGEGFLRLSAFGKPGGVAEAMARFSKI